MKSVFRFESVTVFDNDGKQSVVYGEGADWIAQLGEATSTHPPWRVWFSKRRNAELHAMKLIGIGVSEIIHLGHGQ